MVSNLTSIFRAKNQEKEKKKKKISTILTVSSSSEEVQPAASEMVLTPPIVKVQEIKINEDGKEKEIEIETDEQPSPSIENLENGKTKNEAEENIDHLIDLLNEKLEKSKEIVLNLWDSLKNYSKNIRNEVPNDFKSFCSIFYFSGILFLAFFTLISFSRAIQHQNSGHVDQGWFCRYFTVPFSPLFNALCQVEHIPFVHRLTLEMWSLADEIGLGISQFFATIGSGFAVFGTIFNAIWRGITENLSSGCNELGENVGENISHLLHFFVRIVHLITHVIFSTIATIAGGIAGSALAIQDYFQPTETIFGF